MIKGKPIAGYGLILALVLVVGLIITSIARDFVGEDQPAQAAEPQAQEEEQEEQAAKPAAQQPKNQNQPTIWEGTM